jgi:hypothetical protein
MNFPAAFFYSFRAACVQAAPAAALSARRQIARVKPVKIAAWTGFKKIQ